MSLLSSSSEAERDVDLGRWKRAISLRWWLPVGGAIAGIVLGAVLAFSGGSLFQASVLILPGQPFTPNGGTPVLTYQASPRAIQELVTSEEALKAAADAGGVPANAYRGRISVTTVTTGITSTATRGANLIKIVVQGKKQKATQLAANTLADYVVSHTTSSYIRKVIATYKADLASYKSQLDALSLRLEALNSAIKTEKLAPLDQLVLVSQIDNAEQRQGTLIDSQSLTQELLALAENVSITQVLNQGVAVKAAARSSRNSMLIGLLLGLIIGSVAAVVADSRGARPRTA